MNCFAIYSFITDEFLIYKKSPTVNLLDLPNNHVNDCHLRKQLVFSLAVKWLGKFTELGALLIRPHKLRSAFEFLYNSACICPTINTRRRYLVVGRNTENTTLWLFMNSRRNIIVIDGIIKWSGCVDILHSRNIEMSTTFIFCIATFSHEVVIF